MRTAFAAGTCAAVTVAILWWHKRKASSRVLLVFDLNGVLCTRFQGLGGTALQTVSRSHAESFLSFAFAHFDVAMMTAQHRPRLLSELEQLCTSEQLRQLVFAWDGSHNAIMKGVYSPTSPAIPSKSKSGKPWFLKRLSDISSATGRSAERILIVDDAAEKLFGNPHGSGLIVPQIDCGEKCGSTSAMMAIAKNMRDNRPLDNFLAPDGHFTRALAELAAAAAANARLNVHAWTATHPFLQTLCHDDATMMLDPASNALCSGVRTAEEAAADDGRIIADYPYKVRRHPTGRPAASSPHPRLAPYGYDPHHCVSSLPRARVPGKRGAAPPALGHLFLRARWRRRVQPATSF